MKKIIASVLALGLIAASGVATEVMAKAHDNGKNPASSLNGGEGGNTAKNAARGGGIGNGNGGNSANAPGAAQGQDLGPK